MPIYLFLLCSFYFYEEKPRETLIFIDKTESVHYTGEVLDRAKSEMEELIVQRFYKGYDVIKVYFIHGYTSATKASQSFQLLPPSCDEKLPSLKKKLCLNSYLQDLDKKRKMVLDSLIKTLQRAASSQTKNSTDILGAIETACNHKKYMLKSHNDADLHVYLFSDMIQTANFINLKNIGQLSLSKVSLRSNMDLPIIKDNYLNVNKSYLQGIIVHIKTPGIGINTPAHMKNLKYYWESVLNKLGVKEVHWDE
jgi:hypothetical protein